MLPADHNDPVAVSAKLMRDILGNDTFGRHVVALTLDLEVLDA